jgi:hypothetical protein
MIPFGPLWFGGDHGTAADWEEAFAFNAKITSKARKSLRSPPPGILRRWRTACLDRLPIALCMIPWSVF